MLANFPLFSGGLNMFVSTKILGAGSVGRLSMFLLGGFNVSQKRKLQKKIIMPCVKPPSSDQIWDPDLMQLESQTEMGTIWLWINTY